MKMASRWNFLALVLNLFDLEHGLLFGAFQTADSIPIQKNMNNAFYRFCKTELTVRILLTRFCRKQQFSLPLLFFFPPQVRLIMKTYAFVRSNVPRALAYKPHQSGDSQEVPPCPGFSKFLYFLFAPTLIYKDEYPRSVLRTQLLSNLYLLYSALSST